MKNNSDEWLPIILDLLAKDERRKREKVVKLIYIVAYSYRDAQHFAGKYKIPRNQFRYVDDPERLRGLPAGDDIEIVLHSWPHHRRVGWQGRLNDALDWYKSIGGRVVDAATFIEELGTQDI